MARYCYGTKTALDWIISHFFYDEVHYTYLSTVFFPYRLNNPASSNPLEIYENIYKAWKSGDPNDKFLLGHRIGMGNGVIAKVAEGVLDEALGTRLKDVCDRNSVQFLYPVVYRTDIDGILPSRSMRAGSALSMDSSELLVKDLAESEFDILFLDFKDDPDLQRLFVDAVSGAAYTDTSDVIDILERRCGSVRR